MTKVRLSSGTVIGFLLGAAAATVAAFVLAPAALLSGRYGDVQPLAALRAATGRGLVEYWRGGGAAYPPPLARLVHYWFLWHAIKVVISSLMIAVFVLLAVALWRRYLDGRSGRAVGAVCATVAATVATGLLVLNIQATAVPVIALLPLAGGPPGGEVARTQQAMRQALNGPHTGSPALTALLGEAERYQWVLVAVAATLLVAAGLASAWSWRRRRGAAPRVRVMHRTLGITLALIAILLLLLAASSIDNAFDPAATLRAALDAG